MSVAGSGHVMVTSHMMRCDVDGLCCVMSRDAMRCHGDELYTTLPENRSILGNLRNLPNLGGKIRKIRKILENRPRFSERSSPDGSRESNPILQDSQE